MTWNAEYWEQMERLFWDPVRIGSRRIIELCQECAKKKPDSRLHGYGKVMAKLRRNEVPFNDILNLFLRIAPAQMPGRLFADRFGQSLPEERFEFIGHEMQRLGGIDQANITQQDVFLLAPATILMIEVKIDAVSSLLQVAKYALLAALKQRDAGHRNRVWLLYLIPTKPFPKLWQEKFRTVEELMNAVRNYDPRDCGRRTLENVFKKHYSEYCETVGRMQIRIMSYTELSQSLQRQRAMLDNADFGDETLVRLIDGLVAEIEERGLK